MSHRYISDRFLPDKAIDLIDEAASSLKMQIDSVPAEIDEYQRKITQLEIEREALKKEIDPESKKRLVKIGEDHSKLIKKCSNMSEQWQSEKKVLTKKRSLKEQVESAIQECEVVEREGHLERAAELKFGTIPRLTRELEDLEGSLNKVQDEHKMLNEEVGEEDISRVVARWTGIPVERMMESELSLIHI